MSVTLSINDVSRRMLLERALLLITGVAATRTLPAYAATLAQTRYFTAPRFALLEDVADVMIPETDTAGARSAAVPAYVDQMIASWGSAETKAQFNMALDAIDANSQALLHAGFRALTQEQKLELLAAHDATELSKPGSPYARLKELLLTAYYLSEPGATQELRYEPIPGIYRGDIPLSEIGRAWAV